MNVHYRLLPLALALTIPAKALAQDGRPNIILFLVDDMGWQETSVPFYKDRTALNDRYRTPNIQRLADIGVRFTEAYACAVSSPSRCSLISGMNAARHRVTNWTLRYGQMTDVDDPEISPPLWHCNGVQADTVSSYKDKYLSTLITPLPQILKDAGYTTILCGKAHFGAQGTASEDPRSLGFEVNIAGGAHGGPASYLGERQYGEGDFHISGLEAYYQDATFLTEALTQEAIRAISKPIAEERPFFLYMSHYGIHIPYDADPRFTPNYRDDDGQGVYDPFLKERLNTQEINHAALIEGVDKSLGDLMDYLAKYPKVAERTIIIFMSDNGGQAIGPRQGRHNYDQNYPARGGKGSALLGGVKEPMIVYWKGHSQAGTSNSNPVMIEDFFPSILEMAGITSYHSTQTVDGISFVKLLKHPKYQRPRDIVWHYPHLWTTGISEQDGYGPTSSILSGDYHLIYYWRSKEVELYNIRQDIGEGNNLAPSQPRLAESLRAKLFQYLEGYSAQYPQYKP